MAEERGRDRFMGGFGSRPSPAAESPTTAVPATPVTSAARVAPVVESSVEEKTPQRVLDAVAAVRAEITAAVQESKGLHERLSRRGHEDAETARVIAARLATIEAQILALA